jgi:hypothetical protein
MTIDMNVKINKKVRPGVALLVVLFIVMAITILSLGFVSRSDVELSCGQNMFLRTKMDYLAESGLEHARGLILNPQDVSTEYWGGGSDLQLTSGSDYYEVVVDRDASDRCNYIVDCNAYRLEGAEKVSLSRLHAELRIDPCIAYWIGASTTVPSIAIINGDVYCGGTLTNSGTISGDVFAVGTISGTGTTTGRQNESVTSSYPVTWPGITVASFEPIKDVNIPTGMPQGNYTGICYSNSDVNMPGNVTIDGTLVINGDLTVNGLNNVITAEKNFPALVVGGQVVMKNSSSLEINGLAQVEQQITDDPNTTNANIDVTGGLFINSGGITSNVISVNITAAPSIASIDPSSTPGISARWSPAAGAFFKSITRPSAE